MRLRKILGRRVVPFRMKVKVVYLGILADGGQVIADDGEVVLLRVDALQAADALDGAFLQAVAADGILAVGGIDEETAVVQQVDDALQVGGVVVLVVEFQQHKSGRFKYSPANVRTILWVAKEIAVSLPLQTIEL